MRMKKLPLKRLALAFGALLVVSALGIKTFKPKLLPLAVEIAGVKERDLSQVVVISGELQASRSADLSFGAYGTVSWVGVQVGDWVAQYQALASIDETALRESLLSAQIAYQTAVTNLDKAIEAEAGIQAEYRDTQETDYIRAQKAQYKQATDVARQGVASAQSALRVAEDNLRKATLVSPFAGVVTAVNIERGEEYLATSGTAIKIADTSGYKFIGDVDEAEVGKIAPGQRAVIVLNAYENDEMTALVRKIAPASHLDASGSKVFSVELSLEKKSAHWRVGLEGDAEITTRQKRALSVPWEAVVFEGKDAFVFVVKDGRAHKQEVALGIQTADFYEVKQGLAKGDLVVISPPESLKDGGKVKSLD